MKIYFQNTLTGGKKEFIPIVKDKVGIYNCGPTVYDSVHIGNIRTFVMYDILRRVFEYNNYFVT
ncbi:MAG: cysteine--tRNA ligase, partial [Patescibacteria group bacterium]